MASVDLSLVQLMKPLPTTYATIVCSLNSVTSSVNQATRWDTMTLIQTRYSVETSGSYISAKSPGVTLRWAINAGSNSFRGTVGTGNFEALDIANIAFNFNVADIVNVTLVSGGSQTFSGMTVYAFFLVDNYTKEFLLGSY